MADDKITATPAEVDAAVVLAETKQVKDESTSTNDMPPAKKTRVRKADLTPEQLAALESERAEKRKEARKQRRDSDAIREREKASRRAYRDRQKALVLLGKKWRDEAKAKAEAEINAVAAVEAAEAAKKKDI
jgi:hypothetical protein